MAINNLMEAIADSYHRQTAVGRLETTISPTGSKGGSGAYFRNPMSGM